MTRTLRSTRYLVTASSATIAVCLPQSDWGLVERENTKRKKGAAMFPRWFRIAAPLTIAVACGLIAADQPCAHAAPLGNGQTLAPAMSIPPPYPPPLLHSRQQYPGYRYPYYPYYPGFYVPPVYYFVPDYSLYPPDVVYSPAPPAPRPAIPNPAVMPPAAVAPMPEPNLARVDFQLPADAQLWIQGVKMTQVGSVRRFVTPPLKPGREYGYEIRVVYQKDGKEVTEFANIDVRAGDRKTFMVLTSPPAALPPMPKAD